MILITGAITPGYGQGVDYASWITNPNTRVILGISFLFSLIGLPVLIYLHKKSNLSTDENVEKMLEEGDIDNALTKHGEKIRSNPTLTQKLASVYSKKGRSDSDATQIYEKVYKTGNYTPEIIQSLAHSYALLARDDSKAVEIYMKAIKEGLNEPTVLQITGDHYLKKKEWANAASVLTQLITRGNSSPETYVQLAQCFLQMQRHDDTAMDIYQSAVAAAPHDTTLILALATFYTERNKLDSSAEIIYEEALKIKPDLITTRLMLSRTYLAQGKLSLCIDQCQYLIKRGIMDDEVQRLLAAVYLETQQWEEAGIIYDRLVEKSPEDRDIIIGLARAYAGVRRLDKDALIVYKKAIDLNQELIPVWEQLFRIYLVNEDIEYILKTGNKILPLSDDSWRFLVPELEKLALRYPLEIQIPILLGNAYCLAHQTDYALSSFVRALDISTDISTLSDVVNGYSSILAFDINSREARLRRAKLFIQLDKTMEAIEDFEWIHEKEGHNQEINKLLMPLYQKISQNAELVTPYIRYHMGKLYEEQGLWHDAILEYQQSAKDSQFEQKSSLGMAKCFLEMKQLDIAAELLSQLILNDQVKDLLYSLAHAYRQSEKYEKALETLDKIYKVDAKYKDVGVMLRETRMRSLESQMEKTAVPKTVVHSETPQRFKIIEEIARGGMGIVCCAMDTVLNEMVALKMLSHELADDPQILERFLREVKSTRKLVHRNIVRVYDIVEEQGNKYIIMEYVIGQNLRELLKDKNKLTELEVAGIIRQVCLALQDAHEQGVIHRDIKPANIMIDSTNTVKVMDFGIAKIKDSQKLTLTTDFVGTPLYMSPEQTQGLEIDGRSDLYSLGIMMYELLTGEVPFPTGNVGYQHIHVVPPPPEGATEPMQKIIMKLIAKRPEERYQDAGQLREALDKLYPPKKDPRKNN